MSAFIKTSEKNIFKNKKSGIYYWRECIGGVSYTKSTKEKTIGAARSKVKHFRRKLDLIDEKKKAFNPSFDDIFEFLLEIQKSKSEKTYAMAVTQVELHLRPWFRKNCPKVDSFVANYEFFWAKYKQDQARKTPGRKLEHDRRHLLMALLRAYNNGQIHKCFNKKDFDLKEWSNPIGKYVEDKDVQRILSTSKKNKRLYLQILLAVTMGLRKTEILGLRKDEVDLVKKEIRLDGSRTKIRQVRKVPIPIADDVYVLLEKQISEVKGKFVFPKKYVNQVGKRVDFNQAQTDLSCSWRRLKEKLQLDVRFHDLRHTAITNMLASGIPMGTVSKVVGASERVINRIYDHINHEMKDELRKMFNGRFVKNL